MKFMDDKEEIRSASLQASAQGQQWQVRQRQQQAWVQQQHTHRQQCPATEVHSRL